LRQLQAWKDAKKETESERSRILNRPFKEGFEKELAEYNICLSDLHSATQWHGMLRLLKHRDAICKTVCQNMQRGLDPTRCGKDCSDYHLFKRAVPSARCASALAEVMRDNEVQSEPVIAKFKEGAVLLESYGDCITKMLP
jgi:hypothetical protein